MAAEAEQKAERDERMLQLRIQEERTAPDGSRKVPDSIVEVEAMAVVRSHLDVPSSASFGWHDEWTVKWLRKDTYEVRSIVRHRNLFNAPVEHDFVCVLKKLSDNNWSSERCDLY